MLKLASREQILTRLAGKVQLVGCCQGEQFMFQQGVGRKLVKNNNKVNDARPGPVVTQSEVGVYNVHNCSPVKGLWEKKLSEPFNSK